MDLKQKAEELLRILRKRDSRIISIREPLELIESALIEVRNEALEEAFYLCDWRTLPTCNDKGHDDRWCARCETMKDAADIIEQKISSLKKEMPK